MKRWPSVSLVCLGFSLFLNRAAGTEASCTVYADTGHYMGTTFSITVCTEKDSKGALQAIRGAFQEIDRVEKAISDWREDSETSAVNRAAGKKPVRVGSDLMVILPFSRQVSELSGGAFDATVGPLMELWGFRSKAIRAPSDAEISRTLERVGYRNLVVDEEKKTLFLKKKGMKLDLGAVGKGYGVDCAGEILQRQGIGNLLVEGGGDLLAIGKKGGEPWKVGIQDPQKEGLLQVISSDKKTALATSGDYRSFVEYKGVRYGHILDPRNGRPVSGVRSVSVIAPTAMEADALATTLFVLGVRKGLALLKEFPDAEALMMDGQGDRHATPGWPKH